MATAHATERGHGVPVWPLFIGGFIGPFGGGLTTPMLPELSARFDTTLATAAWSLTAYLLPFSVVLLISGTLGDHWGRRRTVQGAYIAYAAASILCVVAPTITLFLGGRALQGIANAFTTPLLVAAIFDAVPEARLGHALGRFGGMQAVGMALAPLAGGIAGAINYRLAFVVCAALACALAFVPPRDPVNALVAAEGEGMAHRWKVLVNRRLARVCSVALLLGLATTGVTLLAALLTQDRFGLGPTGRGMAIASFGIAGLFMAGRIGHVVDRFGPHRAGIVIFAAMAVVVGAMGLAGQLWFAVLCVAFAGACTIGGRVVVNSLSVRSTPSNPAGAASMSMSWLFLGSSMAPLLLIPAYEHTAELGFAVAGLGALLAAALLVPKTATSAV